VTTRAPRRRRGWRRRDLICSLTMEEGEAEEERSRPQAYEGNLGSLDTVRELVKPVRDPLAVDEEEEAIEAKV
jgi:hypothetical protein